MNLSAQKYDRVSAHHSCKAQAKIIQMLLKVTSPEIMTELNEYEVKLLTRLLTVSQIYDCKALEKVVLNYMLTKISYKREGRKEIIKVARPSEDKDDKMRKTLKSMVLGLR